MDLEAVLVGVGRVVDDDAGDGERQVAAASASIGTAPSGVAKASAPLAPTPSNGTRWAGPARTTRPTHAARRRSSA